MKKIFILAAVVAAFSFASCGNGSKPAANADSTAVATDSLGGDSTSNAAAAAVSKLTEGLEKGDAKGMATALTTVQAKIADLAKNDPEQAKAYVSQVQTWILANKDAIKQALAKANNSTLSNAVNTAITSVSALDPADVVNSVKNMAVPSLKDAATDAVNEAVEAKTGIDDAATKATDAVKETQDKAQKAVDKAKEAVKNAPEEVKAKAKEKAADAANKALKGLGL